MRNCINPGFFEKVKLQMEGNKVGSYRLMVMSNVRLVGEVLKCLTSLSEILLCSFPKYRPKFSY